MRSPVGMDPLKNVARGKIHEGHDSRASRGKGMRLMIEPDRGDLATSEENQLGLSIFRVAGRHRP